MRQETWSSIRASKTWPNIAACNVIAVNFMVKILALTKIGAVPHNDKAEGVLNCFRWLEYHFMSVSRFLLCGRCMPIFLALMIPKCSNLTKHLLMQKNFHKF